MFGDQVPNVPQESASTTLVMPDVGGEKFDTLHGSPMGEGDQGGGDNKNAEEVDKVATEVGILKEGDFVMVLDKEDTSEREVDDVHESVDVRDGSEPMAEGGHTGTDIVSDNLGEGGCVPSVE